MEEPVAITAELSIQMNLTETGTGARSYMPDNN